jgi:hypothetical protein
MIDCIYIMLDLLSDFARAVKSLLVKLLAVFISGAIILY